MLAVDRFVFLREEGEVSGPDAWNDPARGKLWLYNLHYFDDLNAVGAAERLDWRRGLIQRGVVENPDEIDGLASASLAAAPGHSREKQAKRMLDVLEK